MGLLGDVVAWFADGEHWHGAAGLPNRMWEHLVLSVVSMSIACVVALPIGLALGHVRRGGAVAVTVVNLGRALPSFALLVLALKAFGFGATPTYVALVALAVPPIFANAYVGVSEVDAGLREAARGMGLSGVQVLRQVELPLAVPMVMAGIRTSAVNVVATATLAAVIGQGGLGRYIIDGQSVRDSVTVTAGALVVALLAVVTELGLGAVQRLATPKGLRAADGHGPAETFAEAVAAR